MKRFVRQDYNIFSQQHFELIMRQRRLLSTSNRVKAIEKLSGIMYALSENASIVCQCFKHFEKRFHQSMIY